MITPHQKARLVYAVLCCLLPLLCSTAAADTAPKLPNLTPDERQWLDEHPVIRFAPDPDFPPIEWIDDSGAFKGVASGYIALAEQMLGVDFQMVHCASWEDVLRGARNGDIDVLSAAAQSEDRSAYLRFTRPHIVFPAVIIWRQDVDADLTLDDLRGMRVVVVAGYVWEEFLGHDYPDLVLERVPDVNTGLRKVSFGLADAMVANLATTIHYMENEGITNLRVAGETGYLSKLSFATRRDWPVLHGLLSKVVDAIDEDQRDSIRHAWVRTITPEPAFNRALLIALGISALVTLALSAGIMAWNRALKKQVEQRTEELQRELAERKRIEASLRLSEHKYRELVENANSIILRIDARGRITFFNEYAQSFFGYTADEVLGRDCLGLIVPEVDSTTGRDLSEMMNRVKTSPQDFAYNENENIRKNGERVWVAWSNRPIFDENGKLREVLCVG
ncbi:MAG: transporter substrate-binding domain-containing protein, partial [Chitinivibrionales bacterium]|nr:transporter substrate-binding domain-containing protein [Chitinivibrionales bacterium]